jgi:regulator of RNase E activity RraA
MAARCRRYQKLRWRSPLSIEAADEVLMAAGAFGRVTFSLHSLLVLKSNQGVFVGGAPERAEDFAAMQHEEQSPTPVPRPISHGDLLQLKRWNTPTIYNGWEQITRHDAGRDGFNLEETRDFMPQMGPMVGYAVTVVIEPSNAAHRQAVPDGPAEYRRYVGSVPGPKIVVVQDLDKPHCVGAFWGEVNALFHVAQGCVGTIIDGAIRDLDEMTAAGFKALARRLCVGHAHVHVVRWNCEVEVFGRKVRPGDLIHADKHGFLVVPPEDQPRLLDAAKFMDANECNTVIPAARESVGRSMDEILANMEESIGHFRDNVRAKFKREGEW